MQGTGHRTQVATLAEILPTLRAESSPTVFFLLPPPSNNVSMQHNPHPPMKEELMKSSWMNDGRKFCIGGSTLNDPLRPFQS